MAGIGGVVVQFKANADQAIRETKKLARELNDVDTKTQKMSKGVKAGFAAAGTAIAAGAAIMWDAAKAAQADAQEAGRLADVLGTLPGVTTSAIAANEDWITSMMLATNIADTELRDAVGKLALATGDLEEAQRLTAASADLAAVSGKNFSTVSEAMAKAAAGNETALKRMAPWLDTNRDGTLTLAEAMAELESKHRTAAESIADRDPFTKLTLTMDEMKESLGEGLLPAFEEFGKWMSSPEGRKQLEEWTQAMSDLGKAVGEVAKYMDDLYRVWQKASDAGLGGILGFVTRVKGGGGDPAPAARRSGGGTVNVTVNNGKQEPVEDSAALAIRIARRTGGF